jgi:hypothetical protein
VHAPIVTETQPCNFAVEKALEDGVLRWVWDDEDPDVPDAEILASFFGRRVPPQECQDSADRQRNE